MAICFVNRALFSRGRWNASVVQTWGSEACHKRFWLWQSFKLSSKSHVFNIDPGCLVVPIKNKKEPKAIMIKEGFLFSFVVVHRSGAALLGALALHPLCSSIIASQFILKTLHKAAQANAQHPADIPQLYQIQPAQPALYIADKRLWTVKRFGEVALCQPRVDPALFEQFQENEVLVSINRFFHRRHIRPLTGQVPYI